MIVEAGHFALILAFALSLAQASAPQDHGRWYGYGFETHADDPARYYGHSGGAPGQNADVRIFPDQDVVFVGVDNMDNGSASVLADYYSFRMPLKP